MQHESQTAKHRSINCKHNRAKLSSAGKPLTHVRLVLSPKDVAYRPRSRFNVPHDRISRGTGMEQFSPWLRDNWWIAIILFWLIISPLLFLQGVIRSLRDSILKIPEQTQKSAEQLSYLSHLSHLASIDDSLRRIAALMASSEERLRKREWERKEQKRIAHEKLLWHAPPEPPARGSYYERLQKVKDFVERRCGGAMGTTDTPSEVWFSVPLENNEALIEELEATTYIGTTGEKVSMPGHPVVIGRSFQIDLLSLNEDELEQIIRLSSRRFASR
jgi:hypothetical protein